jgi:hypothetical protein
MVLDVCPFCNVGVPRNSVLQVWGTSQFCVVLMGCPPHIVLQVWVAPKSTPFTNMKFTRQPVLKFWCALKLGFTIVCYLPALCCTLGLSPHTLCCRCGWPQNIRSTTMKVIRQPVLKFWCAPKLCFTSLWYISVLCCTHGLSPTHCVASLGDANSTLFTIMKVTRQQVLNCWCAPKLGFTGLCYLPALCCTHGLSPHIVCYKCGWPKKCSLHKHEMYSSASFEMLVCP